MADTGKEFKRLNEILSVLVQYGFREVVDQAIAKRWVPHPRKWRKDYDKAVEESRKTGTLSTARKLKNVLEKLGGIFAKFGQVLSTRIDIMPPEFIEELSSLRSNMPACTFDEIREVFISEMGNAPEELFNDFSEKPVAAASLAQVHSAFLSDGSKVAVKIQRPGIDDNVAIDLKWLLRLGELLVKAFPTLQPYRIIETIQEFELWTLRELNFFVEGRNIECFHDSFERLSFIKLPKVHWRYTSQKVLTMEFMEGVAVDNIDKLNSQGHDIHKIAGNVYYSLLKQTLVDGFFHGDLHPGNLMIGKDGKLLMLDFGLVGELPVELRKHYFGYWTNLALGNFEDAADNLLKCADTSASEDVEGYKREYIEFCKSVHGSSISENSFGSTLNHVTQLASRYKIYFSTSFVLLIRAMLTAEGIIIGLNPDFAFVDEAYPFFRKYHRDLTDKPQVSAGAMLYELGVGFGLWK